MVLLIVILLILFMLGSAPWYPYSANWGYSPVGLLLIILILFLLFGRGRF